MEVRPGKDCVVHRPFRSWHTFLQLFSTVKLVEYRWSFAALWNSSVSSIHYSVFKVCWLQTGSNDDFVLVIQGLSVLHHVNLRRLGSNRHAFPGAPVQTEESNLTPPGLANLMMMLRVDATGFCFGRSIECFTRPVQGFFMSQNVWRDDSLELPS